MFSDSCLVIVDWITSGRHATGEKWDFELYKSSNHIFLGDQPLFLDTVTLLSLMLFKFLWIWNMLMLINSLASESDMTAIWKFLINHFHLFSILMEIYN